MPDIDGKKFPYTKEGMAAAQKARKKKNKKKPKPINRSGNKYE